MVKEPKVVKVSVCTPDPNRIVELADKVIEAKVLPKPADWNSPPARTRPLVVGILFAAPKRKVPPLTVVLPKYVFTLLRINVPEPLLVKLPPVITPDT